MEQPAEQIDALARAFQTILEAGSRLDELPAIKARLDEVVAGQRLETPGALHPDHAYSYAQCAAFLGQKPQSVRQISHELLPRIGHGRVLGIDLMAYRGDVSYDEAKAYKQARRRRILRYIDDSAP